MENNGGSSHDKECVKVAVNIRPLVTSEINHGCTDCFTVAAGDPQVQIGPHSFTFDYVFGNGAIPSSKIFDECVAPLVEALFKGYNGTVLAYGQTGSGKTYTMGTNYNGEEKTGGVIPDVMEMIFSRMESMKWSMEFLIRVSFIEIFKEEVFDLLDPNPSAVSKGEGQHVTKPTGPGRVPIQIRETSNGGITLAGVTEPEVRSKEEMASYLSRGSIARSTGSTNMNSQSSRSHAIFTISMEQKKFSQCPKDDPGDDILSAKLHLVDLAGSERAKRTGADGMRLKEGIHINKGLLALGNVISALGDEKKRKEGGHVPYRDSKLTRLLQDSLGGNSKTVMIACVSPADTNAEETLNTLKYANRARNIQNKAVINRDPVTAQTQRMRSQIEQLQAELLHYRGDSSVSFEELQIFKHKISLLEASNIELRRELQERRITCDYLSQRAVEAQVERDKLIMKVEAARSGKSWDEIDSDGNQAVDLVKTYILKVQKLEGELVRIQQLNRAKRDGHLDSCDSDEEVLLSKTACFVNISELPSVSNPNQFPDDEIDEKELEHSSLQERLDMELKELDKKLEEKEAEMKSFASSDTSVLKINYQKKVIELEHEKKVLQKEIEELSHKLANISSTGDEGTQKLKEEYLQKLNALETQVSNLKKKQEAQTQVLKQKQKSDDAAKRLQEEIQRIKSQKVKLQNQIKQESEQFRMWKASREKEVLQLKKEGRRNQYEMHKLLALNQRQKMVLQRKNEEATVATKRLKELLEARKVASRDMSGSGNPNGLGLQVLMHGIEHDLEVTVRVHEVRSQYERQIEDRAKMAQEITKLKQEAETLRQNNLSTSSGSMSPGARNSRIFALENMLGTSSSTLVSMASQLSEAEERERVFSGRGRWNQVRSLSEAKNLMNHLFSLASSSRCMVRDREIDCIEKDAEIKELKEKVVKLSSLARQLEKNNTDLMNQTQQAQKTEVNNSLCHGSDRCVHELHQGPKSLGFKFGSSNLELLEEDMDTSESEHEDSGNDSGDDQWVHPMFVVERKKRKGGKSGSESQSGTKDCEIPKRQDSIDSVSSGPQIEEDDDIVQQGAALLHSALAEMPFVEAEENGVKRKPLADIGNTPAKSNALRPKQRKKFRKTVIQLVPSALHLTQSEPPRQPDSSTGAEIPSKLPRAIMRSASSDSSNLLRDMNSEKEELSVNKESGECDPSRSSPARKTNKSEEKENFGL